LGGNENACIVRAWGQWKEEKKEKNIHLSQHNKRELGRGCCGKGKKKERKEPMLLLNPANMRAEKDQNKRKKDAETTRWDRKGRTEEK